MGAKECLIFLFFSSFFLSEGMESFVTYLMEVSEESREGLSLSEMA